MSLITCRTPTTVSATCRTPTVVGEFPVAELPWEPTVNIQDGEGSATQILNGGSYDFASAGADPEFFEMQVSNWDNFNPPFPIDAPSPGDDLDISNLQVSCPAFPSYTGEITVPGPTAANGAGAPIRFVIQSNGDVPAGDYEIDVSFDWTCGTQSGTWTGTLTFTVAAEPINAPWAWGSSFYGEVGRGIVNDDVVVPTAAQATPFLASRMAAGDGVTIVLKDDGTLWSMGTGFKGASGHGNTTDVSDWVQIGTDNDWLKVAYSSTSIHGYAIKLNGSLWAWGGGSFGQNGDGANSDRLSPVQVGTDTDWASVAAGGDHGLAIKNDGTLWSWGRGGQGQLGLGGTSNFNTPQQVGSDTDWSYVAGGSLNSFAIKTNGTLWATGYNGFGTLGIGNTFQQNSFVQVGSDTNWFRVASGSDHAGAIKTNAGSRELWMWGRNSMGELGLGDTTQRTSPVKVDSDTYIQICCSNKFTIVRKFNNSIWGCGWNDNTQLGLGGSGFTYVSPDVLTQAGTDADWVDLAAGRSHSCGIRPTLPS